MDHRSAVLRMLHQGEWGVGGLSYERDIVSSARVPLWGVLTHRNCVRSLMGVCPGPPVTEE